MSDRQKAPINLFDFFREVHRLRADRDSGLGPFPWGPATDLVFGKDDPFDRDLRCPSYSDCLGLAAHRNWPHMTCAGCKMNRSRGEAADE